MLKRRLVHYAVVLLLTMCGCAQVGKLASTDLINAAQVATDNRDVQGVACWVALSPVANAIETAPTLGLASTIEADRLFAIATEGPTAPCNTVSGTIFSMVLRKAVPLSP